MTKNEVNELLRTKVSVYQVEDKFFLVSDKKTWVYYNNRLRRFKYQVKLKGIFRGVRTIRQVIEKDTYIAGFGTCKKKSRKESLSL